MGHGDVGHASVAEEGVLASVRAVDELVDEDEKTGIELGPERTAGRDRNEVGHPGRLQGRDIGPVVDARRRQAMAAPVPRQEDGITPAHAAEPQDVRGLAPGRRDGLLADVLQARQIVDPRSADDADDRRTHETPDRFACCAAASRDRFYGASAAPQNLQACHAAP